MAAGEPSCMYKRQTEPKNEAVGKRITGFLLLPVVWVLVSTFMTVLGFMDAKVKEGESWGTLISWWSSLMGQEPFLTVVTPTVLCIGIIIVIIKPWSTSYNANPENPFDN